MAYYDALPYIDELDIEFRSRRVLMRLDCNLPLTEEGEIRSARRLHASLPSIRFLQERGAKLILMSHLGRPQGKPQSKFSLKVAADYLERLLAQKVVMAEDCVGEAVEKQAQELAEGEILMLENLRFHKEEKKEPEKFGQRLAALGDFYVNDAFGSCHRAHGSIVGVPRFLPAAGGLLLKKELGFLGPLLKQPERPYAAILGGAKVQDKIQVIEAFLSRVDAIIIGGAMAYTFLKAQGVEVGASLVENESLEFAQGVLRRASQNGVEILLPEDHLVAKSIEASEVFATEEIQDSFAGFDIGPKSQKKFADTLGSAQTIIMNGPMGVFEKEVFENGTRQLLKALTEAYQRGAYVVIGGGDSAAAAEAFQVVDKVSFVSTGGGASLEFLEGKELPGILALTKSSS